MENAQIRFVFDNKKQATATKTGLLQIEVRKKGTNKRKVISTGIKLLKNQFSDKNGFTCKNHPNAPALTGKGKSIFRKIEAFVLSDKCKTLEDVKYWDKEELAEITVIDFVNSELKRKNPSLDVIKYNQSFIRRLTEYGEIVRFEDLTYEKILGFDAQLRQTISSEPTLYKRHTLFKGYIQEAINRGIYKGTNPYLLFKNKKGKSKDPIFLTETEIQKLKDYAPNYSYLERVRDLYLFQIFTGLSYIDLMSFNRESIVEIDGYEAIRSNRQKTDESYITILLPEAKAIIEKYDYELPVLTNQKYNEYLKEVATKAGINKPLASHSARHTFATYLLNNDIPIETVSRAMGHSNIRMTQHYAKMLGKKVVSDMAVLLKEKPKSK